MSHFSFTRASYDKCALEKKDQESSGPFEWLTDKSVIESKDVCFQSTSPFMQNPFRSVPQGSIDIESELRGNSYQVSKCPSHKYNPETAQQVNVKVNECKDNGLVPEYTRLNRSCDVLSGISINRFHPLCEDVQQLNKIHSNSYIGSNTRLQIKDAFREQTEKFKKNYDFSKDTKTPCKAGSMGCVKLVHN
jgi:hypothetical protein